MSYPTTTFPTTLDAPTSPSSTTQVASFDHAGLESFQNAAILALETKLGINGSAVNTTIDYKLSGVGTGDKASSLTGSETLTNKTLTSPTLTSPIITNKTSTGSDTGAETLSNKTLITPTIASFVNATHNHQNVAGGGTLDASALGSGTIATARLGSGSADNTKFLRGDSTWQVVPQTFNFGDGSDGNVTISSPTTLTRDMYYNNLTVNSTLTTGGWRIYVAGTLSGNGTIDWGTGAAGGNASGQTGGTGASAVSSGHFRNSAGGNGATANNGGGTGGTSPTSSTATNLGIGSAGQTGGNGGNGGVGGSAGNGGAGSNGLVGGAGGAGGAVTGGGLVGNNTGIITNAYSLGNVSVIS